MGVAPVQVVAVLEAKRVGGAAKVKRVGGAAKARSEKAPATWEAAPPGAEPGSTLAHAAAVAADVEMSKETEAGAERLRQAPLRKRVTWADSREKHGHCRRRSRLSGQPTVRVRSQRTG